MQKSINMTFGFAGVRLLGFRVPGLGLGSGREVPHKFKNLTIRWETIFFVFPLQSHICAPLMECETFT